MLPLFSTSAACVVALSHPQRIVCRADQYWGCPGGQDPKLSLDGIFTQLLGLPTSFLVSQAVLLRHDALALPTTSQKTLHLPSTIYKFPHVPIKPHLSTPVDHQTHRPTRIRSRHSTARHTMAYSIHHLLILRFRRKAASRPDRYGLKAEGMVHPRWGYGDRNGSEVVPSKLAYFSRVGFPLFSLPCERATRGRTRVRTDGNGHGQQV